VESHAVTTGVTMLSRIVGHLRGNLVGYVALFAALGGTSYAAVNLSPGSVTTSTLAKGAVTNAKLARNSVGTANVRRRSLTAADFRPGVLNTRGANGGNGSNGKNGPRGPAGPTGPAGHDGSASIAVAAKQGGSVTAPDSATTSVPLSGASWTQGANDLDLITGSMTVQIPATCTGSFGNSLVVDVDGVANTFALAPTAPASGTETVPFVVSELTQPGSDTHHTLTTSLANTCTKSGENYTVSNVKVDVVAFH
jgi:hypothetical protein